VLRDFREALCARVMPCNRWIAALPSVARDDDFHDIQFSWDLC